MLFDHDSSRGFAVKAVEQHGLVFTELELVLQVGATLIAVIAAISRTQRAKLLLRRIKTVFALEGV